MINRRNREAAARFEERQARENDAPRLLAEVPRLETLSLLVDEYRDDDDSPWVSHTRHIVVSRAPALFLLQCSDPDCEDGGYPITRRVMTELRSGSVAFELDEDCRGTRHGRLCRRRAHVTAVATYGD